MCITNSKQHQTNTTETTQVQNKPREETTKVHTTQETKKAQMSSMKSRQIISYKVCNGLCAITSK
jgi:hypothetical protein